MKFTTLKDFNSDVELCMGWINHGCVNEDRTVVFTSTISDRINVLSGDNPLDKLKDALKRYALTPMFEQSGGHFGRSSRRRWTSRDHIDSLSNPGGLFEKVIDGWVFSGNFVNLSAGFTVYVSDKDVARELLELIIENYRMDEYKHAVKCSYTNHNFNFSQPYDDDVSVYYNQSLKSFFVTRGHYERYLPITGKCLDHVPSRDRNWIVYAFSDAAKIGPRSSVDYATLLSEKLEDILN